MSKMNWRREGGRAGGKEEEEEEQELDKDCTYINAYLRDHEY